MTTFPRPKPTDDTWPTRPTALGLTVGCVLLLLYSALIPFEADWAGLRAKEVNWVPYSDPEGSVTGLRFSVFNALANAAAGVPLGWFAFLACPRRWPRGLAWLTAVAAAVLTAVGMEVLQLVIPEREATVTDVLNMGLGGAAGAAAAWALAGAVGMGLRRLSVPAFLDRPEVRLLALWLIFLALRSWFPDQVVASLGGLRTVKRVHYLPGQFPSDVGPASYLADVAGYVLLYALIGAGLQRLQPRGGAPAAVVTGLAVGVLALVIEFGKLFIPSQRADVNLLAAGLAGGLLGASAWLLLERRRDLWLPVCLGVVGVYTALQFLAPGRSLHATAARGSYQAWLPLSVYANHPGAALRAIPDLLQGVILFVPPGWLAAAWSRQRWPGVNTLLAAVGGCAGLAVVMVIVQAVLGRPFTIDAVLWAGLGGAAGYGLWARTELARGNSAIRVK